MGRGDNPKESTMKDTIDAFARALEREELSANTVRSYRKTVESFFRQFDKIDKRSLLSFKGFLVENYKAKTVNLRLQAINRFLDFLKKPSLKLRFVKIQQAAFLENVISDADYRFFARRLKATGRTLWYFVVRFLCATGARVSELVQLKAEHVEAGFLDLYGKGGKLRRLYIPRKLRDEARAWLASEGIGSGYLFRNRFGARVTTRGISHQLKVFAREFGMNTAVVYPHSFRHRFAKNFLEKCNDIALLADLMGHESIETTRIYLRRSATEQRELVDRVVTW